MGVVSDVAPLRGACCVRLCIPQLRTPTVRLQWPTAVWPRCGPCVGVERCKIIMHMHRPMSHGRIEPAHICRACNRLFIRKWCGVWPHSGHKNSRPLQGPHGGPQLWYPMHSPDKRHVVVLPCAFSAKWHHYVARVVYAVVLYTTAAHTYGALAVAYYCVAALRPLLRC